MLISFDKAFDGLIAFMAEQAPKITDDIVKWFSIGGLAVIKINPAPLKNTIRPVLEMLSVMQDGMVDIDLLKMAFDEAFKAVPAISYRKFVFNIDDANGLVAKLHDIASAEMQSQATADCTEVKQ